MELKKKLISTYLILFSLSVVFANEWFNSANEILKNNKEPQVEYWLNFVIQNTKGNYKSEFGTRVYEYKNFKIQEFLFNDDGAGSKSNIKSHSYEIQFSDGNNISLYITKEEIILIFFDNLKKERYRIILTSTEIEYIYGGKGSEYRFKVIK